MTLEIAAEELNRLLSLPACTKNPKKRKKDTTDDVKSKTKRCKIKKEKRKTFSESTDKAVPSDTPVEDSSSGANRDSANITDEMRSRLEHRNCCTVRVSGLPLRCDPSIIYNLAADAQAYRIPWNDHIHGCDGIAFLEFSSEALAECHRDKLNNSLCMNKAITATTGKFVSEDSDEYDPCTLVLHGLHWKTHVAELARRFPSACNIRIRPLRERSDKKKPERAFLTFPDAEAALRAFDTRQGCVIRKRKISILWSRKKRNDADLSDAPKKCLLVSGIKKSVSEADIQAVFPQATSITVNRVSGEAVLDYDLEEDCMLDWKNAEGVILHGRKLKAFPKTSCKFSKISMKKNDSPSQDQFHNPTISGEKTLRKEKNKSGDLVMKSKKKVKKVKQPKSSTVGSVRYNGGILSSV